MIRDQCAVCNVALDIRDQVSVRIIRNDDLLSAKDGSNKTGQSSSSTKLEYILVADLRFAMILKIF